ncbi:acyl carrier protein [Streptomyces finlayi]|nr:acyl carrier protein [Streptomyces finlayi]
MPRDRSDAVATSALSSPSAAYHAADTPPPADSTDEVREFMVRTWSELLGRSDLTEHSDFFVRGGDSLLINRLVRRIGEKFGAKVSLYDMSRRNLVDQVALVHSART